MHPTITLPAISVTRYDYNVEMLHNMIDFTYFMSDMQVKSESNMAHIIGGWIFHPDNALRFCL